MATLNEILTTQMLGYAGHGAKSYTFPAFDDEHQVYALLLVDFWRTDFPPKIIQFARIIGNRILIQQDVVEKKPLVSRLVQNGIPREQIILVYEGEPYPEGAIPTTRETELALS